MADPTGASRPAKRRSDTRDPRRSRERALKILFQADVRGVDAGQVLDRIVDDPHAWAMLDDLDPDEAADLAPAVDAGAADADPEPHEVAEAARRRKALQLDGFTRSLVQGVADHRAELDDLIQRYARRWTVARMPAIDRNVLRLGAYELAYETTSPAIVINEVIELAKRLSTEDSGRYVNGVLESVRRHLADHPLGDALADGSDLGPAGDAGVEVVPGDEVDTDAVVSSRDEVDPFVPDTAVPPPFDPAEVVELLGAEPVDDVLPPPDDEGDAVDLIADPTPEEPASAEDVDDDLVDPDVEVDLVEAEADEDAVDPGAGQQQLF